MQIDRVRWKSGPVAVGARCMLMWGVVILGLHASDAVAAGSERNEIYGACTRLWTQKQWKTRPGPKAMAGAIDKDREGVCFATWSHSSLKAAVDEAITMCKARGHDRCFVFAENNSLRIWSQKAADEFAKVQRSKGDYAYMQCSLPSVWGPYREQTGARSMAVGYDSDGDPYCAVGSGGSWREAIDQALAACKRTAQSCTVFAIGNQIDPTWLQRGDAIRAVKRPTAVYASLACASPVMVDIYDRLHRHKAMVVAIDGAGAPFSCFVSDNKSSVEHAAMEALENCNKNKDKLQCALLVGDRMLAPWAKMASEIAKGRTPKSAEHIAYACEWEARLVGYKPFDGHAAIVVSSAKVGPFDSYRCFTGNDLNSSEQAVAAALGKCRTALGKNSACEVFATGNRVRPKFAGSISQGSGFVAAAEFCATSRQISRLKDRCGPDEFPVNAAEAKLIRNLWNGNYCESKGGERSYALGDAQKACQEGFVLSGVGSVKR